MGICSSIIVRGSKDLKRHVLSMKEEVEPEFLEVKAAYTAWENWTFILANNMLYSWLIRAVQKQNTSCGWSWLIVE